MTFFAYPCDRCGRMYRTNFGSPVCGWCLPKHPILEKKQ